MPPRGWRRWTEMTDPNPFLALPGAVEAQGADAGIAWHYGNPVREQKKLIEAHAIVDLSNRAVLTVTGADRLSWINSLTSQSVGSLLPGESSETLLLDVTGRLEYAVRLVDDGVTLWMLLERNEAPGLLAWLDRMRFMLRVELSDESGNFATIGSLDAPALPVAAPNGVPLVWHDPWRAVTPGGHQYATGVHPGAGWSWSETLVPAAEFAPLAERAAAGELSVAGLLAVEALRIEAWRPRFATEVDEKTIPHELDWLRTAVHLNKGCYRGQETVAKVHNLGHPPRRLVMLHLDGSDGVLPARGSSVWITRDGARRDVGVVTSSALHYELGPIALAVIKRSTDPHEILSVDADDVVISAAQETVVPPEAGAEANVPRLPRIGAVTR